LIEHKEGEIIKLYNMPEDDNTMYFLRMVLLYDQVIIQSKMSASKGFAALALFQFMEVEAIELMKEDQRFRLLLISKVGSLEKEISENSELRNIIVRMLGEDVLSSDKAPVTTSDETTSDETNSDESSEAPETTSDEASEGASDETASEEAPEASY